MSNIPTEKEQKYDRQLRLWGTTGQQRLEQGCVCLLNASACGTETLKNLALPNIGNFIIVEGGEVTPVDCGTNFFVTPEDIGKRKAEVACRWVCELNPDVKGRYLDQDPIELVKNNPAYFIDNGVTVVVATQLEERYLTELSKRLSSDGIALVAIRSYGMIGFVRVQGPPRGVVETFPDSVTEDLRLLEPFPALLEYCQSVGCPDTIDDSMLHAHIPYPVLLMDAVATHRERTGFQGEYGYAERKALQKILEEKRRSLKEENFREAINSLHKINTPAVPAEVNSLLNHSNVENILSLDDIDEFWVCVAALAQFYKQVGKLPLNGQLKDLTATTQWFVALQGVYQARAAQDREALLGICAEINRQRIEQGRKSVPVPEEFLNLFVKNVWALRFYNSRPIFQEYDTPNTSTLSRGLVGDDHSLKWYILLRAGDKFIAQHGRVPGEGDGGACEEDVLLLHRLARDILQDSGVKLSGETIPLDFTSEWHRFGGSEVHCISAVLGGVAAQEVIKLITGQRVPLNNTFVYDGIKGSFHTYAL